MQMIDHDLSLKLSRLSFIAAVMVMLQHAYAPFWSGTIETVLCHGLVIWDVPYFFIAAGFLLFKDWDGWDFKWYKRKVLGRVRSLLVPYVFWTAWGIVFGALAVYVGIRHNLFHFDDFGWWLSATGISEASMFNGYLWFIRRLFLFVLISPVIPLLARRVGWWLVPVFMAMYIFNVKSAG